MPNTSGTHSYGAKLQVNDNDDGNTFVDVAEVIDVKGPEITVGTVKATNLQSPNAALEKLAGMIDGGKVTFSLTFTKAQLNTMYGYVRKRKNWRVLFPIVGTETTPTRWDCLGHWTKCGTEIPDPESNERVKNDFEIDVSGKPTLTQGS